MKILPTKGIPLNTPYCYTCLEINEKNGRMKIKRCRYFKHIRVGYRIRKTRKVIYCDYCKYLRRKLSIDDMVKDCGINDPDIDITEEEYNEAMKSYADKFIKKEAHE